MQYMDVHVKSVSQSCFLLHIISALYYCDSVLRDIVFCTVVGLHYIYCYISVMFWIV